MPPHLARPPGRGHVPGFRGRGAGGGRRSTLWTEIAEGLGWLAAHRVLRAPFVAAGVVIPVAALLRVPAVNNRAVAAARAAAGLEPGPSAAPRRSTYIRSGASTPISPSVLASTWRVALTSHQRALESAWSSVRTRHSP